MTEARRRGEEYLLERRLFRRKSTGQVPADNRPKAALQGALAPEHRRRGAEVVAPVTGHGRISMREIDSDLARKIEAAQLNHRIRERLDGHQHAPIDRHSGHDPALVVDMRSEWTYPQRCLDQKTLRPVARPPLLEQPCEPSNTISARCFGSGHPQPRPS